MLDRSEKRTDIRHRVLKDGKLLVNPPSGTIDVKIRDLSNGGARVELGAPCELPVATALIIVQNATITDCTVMWQRGQSAGLKFMSAARKVGIRRF